MKKIIVTLPVHNEEFLICDSLAKLTNFCKKNLQNYDWRVVIADNNSTDGTGEIVRKLEKESFGKIIYKFIPQKGKGLAIKESWKSFGGYLCFYGCRPCH